jgi:hypothetical protein
LISSMGTGTGKVEDLRIVAVVRIIVVVISVVVGVVSIT